MPNYPLDGELWCGRGLFQKTVSIVKRQKGQGDAEWKYVHYLVFDAPKHGGKYEERVKFLHDKLDPISLNADSPTNITVVGTQVCKGKDHLMQMLDQVIKKGGEGIMLRKPASLYEHGRSWALLKLKMFHDEEAKVIGHKPGSGRLANAMGALECQLANGVRVKVGSGFSDAQRYRPPKIGSVITFKYQEVSDSGTPRFPVFLRVREDVSWEDVLAQAKVDKPFSQLQKKASLLNKQHSVLFSAIPSRDPSTGKKIVTSDDEDDHAQDSSLASADGKPPPCKFGATCYRTNASHLSQFSHPAKAVAAAAEQPQAAAAEKKECTFGRACYRRSESHLAAYSHPAATGDPGKDIDPDILKKARSDDEGESSGTEEDVSLAPGGAAASKSGAAPAAVAGQPAATQQADDDDQLENWLASEGVGLEPSLAQKVAATFKAEEVFTPFEVMALSDAELEKIGIKLGSRKKILAASAPANDDLPECHYGAKCTRKGAAHRTQFSHSGGATTQKRAASAVSAPEDDAGEPQPKVQKTE